MAEKDHESEESKRRRELLWLLGDFGLTGQFSFLQLLDGLYSRIPTATRTMALVTALPWVQILTALTIPAIVIVITHSRTSTDEPVHWQHASMMVLLSAIPAALLLGFQGAWPPLVFALIGAVVLLAFLKARRQGHHIEALRHSVPRRIARGTTTSSTAPAFLLVRPSRSAPQSRLARAIRSVLASPSVRAFRLQESGNSRPGRHS